MIMEISTGKLIEKIGIKDLMHTDLTYHFLIQQAIRDFFKKEDFLETTTPPMVENPGMETHIHPFAIRSVSTKNNLDLYLHTSPEFYMKKLLSEGYQKIFNLTYAFRDEPSSPHHRPQFLMLEWYRAQAHYEKIMDDCEQLFIFCHEFLAEKKAPMHLKLSEIKFERLTIQELFQEYLKFDILQFLDSKDLKEKIKKDFKLVPIPESNLSWDDYYFLLFLNTIESKLKDRPYLLLKEFPHHLAALATLKESDPRVCERFEIYVNGIELCNCFNELRDLKLQKNRFDDQAKLKKELYGYELPEAKVLYQALEKGFPPSSGIALGVERLLLSLANVKNPFFN